MLKSEGPLSYGSLGTFMITISILNHIIFWFGSELLRNYDLGYQFVGFYLWTLPLNFIGLFFLWKQQKLKPSKLIRWFLWVIGSVLILLVIIMIWIITELSKLSKW